MIKELSSRLKEMRKLRGLSQEQVAGMVGISHDSISSYERGFRDPPLDVLIKFAHLYRVSTDYLLGLSKNKSKSIDMSILDENAFEAIGTIVDIINRQSEQIRTLSKR